nr:hypothetical protein [Tanacetum cinerariifolium]
DISASFEYQRPMLMVPFSNKSFPALCVKSFGSTAYLEKCCEMRKLDSMSYHTRGESAKSIALGALATGTGETTIVGGLKYSLNMGWNKLSQSSLFGRLQGG